MTTRLRRVAARLSRDSRDEPDEDDPAPSPDSKPKPRLPRRSGALATPTPALRKSAQADDEEDKLMAWAHERLMAGADHERVADEDERGERNEGDEGSEQNEHVTANTTSYRPSPTPVATPKAKAIRRAVLATPAPSKRREQQQQEEGRDEEVPLAATDEAASETNEGEEDEKDEDGDEGEALPPPRQQLTKWRPLARQQPLPSEPRRTAASMHLEPGPDGGGGGGSGSGSGSEDSGGGGLRGASRRVVGSSGRPLAFTDPSATADRWANASGSGRGAPTLRTLERRAQQPASANAAAAGGLASAAVSAASAASAASVLASDALGDGAAGHPPSPSPALPPPSSPPPTPPPPPPTSPPSLPPSSPPGPPPPPPAIRWPHHIIEKTTSYWQGVGQTLIELLLMPAPPNERFLGFLPPLPPIFKVIFVLFGIIFLGWVVMRCALNARRIPIDGELPPPPPGARAQAAGRMPPRSALPAKAHTPVYAPPPSQQRKQSTPPPPTPQDPFRLGETADKLRRPSAPQ